MKRYALHMLAPDGEFITEGSNFPTIEAAWERANNMGSRWIFYPIPVVTGPGSGFPVIRDTPAGMNARWKGKQLRSLIRAMKANPDLALAYAEGRAPFYLEP